VEKSIASRDYRVFLHELRGARKRARLTQVELAARLGETQSFISKCKRGERRLDLVELRAFCKAIGFSLSAFVERLDRRLAAAEEALPGRGGSSGAISASGP
jgi:transcriptional regulator with XRE-family HTH domain